MKKVSVLTLGMMFLTIALSYAQQTAQTAQTTQATPAVQTVQTVTQPIEVGNTICPVSKNPVVGSMGDKPVKIVYKGKTYNLCCPGCVNAFNKDPEKYSKIADAEAAAKIK